MAENKPYQTRKGAELIPQDEFAQLVESVAEAYGTNQFTSGKPAEQPVIPQANARPQARGKTARFEDSSQAALPKDRSTNYSTLGQMLLG